MSKNQEIRKRAKIYQNAVPLWQQWASKGNVVVIACDVRAGQWAEESRPLSQVGTRVRRRLQHYESYELRRSTIVSWHDRSVPAHHRQRHSSLRRRQQDGSWAIPVQSLVVLCF